MLNLEVRITVRPNRGTGPQKPRFSKLSDIRIVAVVKATEKGKPDSFATVATRTIPGEWNARAAMLEFKKNPKLFTFEQGCELVRAA